MSGSVGIKGEDINVETDPLAGVEDKKKAEVNAAMYPNAKARKKLGLPKPTHIPKPKHKGYHRKKR